VLYSRIKKSSPVTRQGGAWGVGKCSLYSFSTSLLVRGWVINATPRLLLTPGEKTASNTVYRRMGGPPKQSGRSGLNKVLLCQEKNHGRPGRSQTLYWGKTALHWGVLQLILDSSVMWSVNTDGWPYCRKHFHWSDLSNVGGVCKQDDRGGLFTQLLSLP
jgi:hypothetical protein